MPKPAPPTLPPDVVRQALRELGLEISSSGSDDDQPTTTAEPELQVVADHSAEEPPSTDAAAAAALARPARPAPDDDPIDWGPNDPWAPANMLGRNTEVAARAAPNISAFPPDSWPALHRRVDVVTTGTATNTTRVSSSGRVSSSSWTQSPRTNRLVIRLATPPFQ